MKIKINKELLNVIKVSGLSVVVACGSGGGGGKPIGVDTSSLNPKKVFGSDSASSDQGEGSAESESVEGESSGEPSETPSDPAAPAGPADQGSTSPDQPQGAGQGPGDAGAPQAPGTPSKEPEIQKIFAKTGIRNFAQINATMSALTGVPTTNAQVAAFYTAQATSLPTDNDVKGFIGSHQVTIFKLAVEYCDVLVKDATLRATVFGTFNFAAAPNAAFTPDTKKALADSLVSKFWGKNLSNLSPHTENVTLVVTLIDDLLTGRDLTVATQTPGIVTGTCAGVLSSAPVTLY
jgi:hypothetical protein